VAHDVGQALLHDSVHDVVQVRGNGCLLERDVEPALAHPIDEGLERLEPRTRQARPADCTGVEQLEHHLELSHGLRSGLVDGLQRVPCRCRVSFPQRGCGRRLQHHHADGVAGDVVQLPSNAEPLVAAR
jgi:hypothetical protein